MTSPRRTVLAAVLGALWAAGWPAAAQTFPTRSGESGLLDVPDAEVMALNAGLLAAELRFDQPAAGPSNVGPLPIYAVGGFLPRMELGFTMREWGQPGDPQPSQLLFGSAVKLQLVPPRALFGFALDAYADRLNGDEVLGGRFICSTPRGRPVRLAAFVGAEFWSESGVTYGGAAAVPFALPFGDAEVVVEALRGPRGANYGGALRLQPAASVAVSLGFNYLPSDDGFRVSLGIGFGAARKKAAAPTAAPEQAQPVAVAAAEKKLAFLDERPRFRLRIRMPDPVGTDPRPLAHAPPGATVAVRAAAPAAAVPAPAVGRAAAPTLEDLAEAQLREQESLASTRERRVQSTSDQLDQRDAAATADARGLEARERDLAAREQQLDLRERRIAFRGPPSQQQRQLESLEAQLAAQERQAGALERSLLPAIDASAGRERDAAAREEAERQEASRLAASVAGAPSRALQIELRKQAAAARNRQLAALEARLVAKGERIDAVERRLRTRAERIEAWGRRLDARSERLALSEKRAEEPLRPAPPATGAAPEGGVAAKDKPAFVMIVKSPAAILKERPAPAPAPGGGLQAGVAVERAVAAATVIMFPTAATPLSEIDRETVDNIARLAARESCTLLVWARAKDPSLMGEAQRRAAEIKARVMEAGPLAERQIQTRITARPGSPGVDVVVSALREIAKPAAPAQETPAAPALLTGEIGKRQIREAVQAAQRSIEACVGETLARRRVDRAEGLLKLSIASSGRVVKVLTGGGDLSGAEIEECLNAAARAWTFPTAEAEYVVDVPITVLRGGAAR